MIEMKCDCCGKTFTSKYWDGGYIDHFMNFADNRHWYAKRKDRVLRMSHDIIFGGSGVRSFFYIKEFLDCCMTWDCISDSDKESVRIIVETYLNRLAEAKKEATEIRRTASPLAYAYIKGDITEVTYKIYNEIMEERRYG